MRFDVFCRVIDNYGDIGVCWRLAADLAARGEQVRLWVDDAVALRWMAPLGKQSVTVLDWSQAHGAVDVGDVVIEAFGCELPSAFVQAMAVRSALATTPAPPVWINLEYLTAERYAVRSHGLQSPQLQGPGAGLRKWFFYPGFESGSGGLLREADLPNRQQAFSATQWLAANGVEARAGERVVSLFCYDNPRLSELLTVLSAQTTLLLVTAGIAAQKLSQILAANQPFDRLRVHYLPWLSQPDYDHLLWASDLNFVRGEDSFVRAQWAGKPFVWQIYPQQDDAHVVKLRAFVDLFEDVTKTSPLLWSVWSAWNGISAAPIALPTDWKWQKTWQAASHDWRSHLLNQSDLTCRLQSFVNERR
ncbi:MAG: elongation factor P maturation arginine rhamnosyltransferase EarP [Pseudorhodobacter sp.]|nr:elongation factor P maturation arginine rhamnosyltransferase EarP [Rhizobacter sp.]